jgi:hypothetical protein
VENRPTGQDRGAAWALPVVAPGPETAALSRFHWDCDWTGTIEPDKMGSGSPRMSTMGHASFAWTDNGFWQLIERNVMTLRTERS